MNYFEKLQDPRWQRKRLAIFERDEWKCQLCGDTETQLHAHHKTYRSYADPWDYPDEELITYCKDCHHGGHIASHYKEIGVILSLPWTPPRSLRVDRLTLMIEGAAK